MRKEFQRLPFEPYARVRRQYLNILRAVNKKRKTAGFEMVSSTVLRLHRKRPKVYADDRPSEVAQSSPPSPRNTRSKKSGEVGESLEAASQRSNSRDGCGY